MADHETAAPRDELLDYLIVLWRRKGLIFGGTVLAAAVSLGVSLIMPKTYEASAKLLIVGPKFPDVSSGGRVTREAVAGTIAGMIENQSLAEKAIQRFGLYKKPFELNPESFLRKVIEARWEKNTNLILLKVAFPDPKIAADIANFIAERAVELNRALSSSETIAARDYIKIQLEEARASLDQAQGRLLEFQQEALFSSLEKEIQVLLSQKESLEKNYFKVELHLENLKASPLKTNLDEAEKRLLGFRQQIDVESLKNDKEMLLRQKKFIVLALNEVETTLRENQAKSRELAKQLKQLKKVETIKKTIAEEPGLLMAAREATPGAKSNLLNLQMESEEFNPVYRETENTLIGVQTAQAGFEEKQKNLRERLKETELLIADINRRLAEKKIQETRLSDEYELVRKEWKGQYELAKDEWKGQVVASPEATLVRKKILEIKMKRNEARLAALQSELAMKNSRLEALKRAYDVAKEAFLLYSKRYSEASLSVASRFNELKILDRAIIPQRPVRPRIAMNTLIGGGLGLMVFVFAAFFVEYLREAQRRETA